MELRQLNFVLPGQHLAEISPEMAPADAANFLAIWTAIWHPALLAQTRKVPYCRPVEELLDLGELPRGELALVPAITPIPDDASLPLSNLQAPGVGNFETRQQVIAELSKSLDRSLDISAGDDFYALAYAYLQVELLTQSVSFEPLIDQVALNKAVVEGADAALDGNDEEKNRQLDDAYDLLMLARNHYYPVDMHLVDLSLLAPTTVGLEFKRECAAATAGNVLVTSDVLNHMAQHEPDSLDALRKAVEERRISVCGGSQGGESLAAMSPESLLRELRAGQLGIEQHLGRRPNVFAHHQGPVAPLVPGVLQKLGYYATLLCNFSGQSLPSTATTRTAWTGLDNAYLEALNAKPIDMGTAAGLLSLASATSRTMGYDLAGTLLLSGWSGHRSEFFDDLLCVARRSPLLGRLITLDEYFDITTAADQATPLHADAYPSPQLAANSVDEIEAEPCEGDELLEWPALAQFASPGQNQPGDPAQHLANLLGAKTQAATGRLRLNASSVTQSDREPLLPGFGWSWEPTGAATPTPTRAEPGVLRNERMEVVFDEQTGGISAARFHNVRGNLLSQQLVLDFDQRYQLAFDGWEVLESSESAGRLASDFRIVDSKGTTLGKLRQSIELQASSNALAFVIDFQSMAPGEGEFRIASRIAYRDETATLSRGLQGIDLVTQEPQFISGCVGIRDRQVPIALLCDRQRLHRRVQPRVLDTHLPLTASSPCQVRLSYLLDCAYPAHPMQLQRRPQLITHVATGEPTQQNGWWVRLGAANLLATYFGVEPQGEHGLLRMRILETSGRPTNTALAAWRPFVDAQAVNFRNEPNQLLHIRDGEVQLQLAAYEWIEVIAAW